MVQGARTPWSACLERESSPAGSGVLIDERLLLTCAHVVQRRPSPDAEPERGWQQGWRARFGTVEGAPTYDVVGLADAESWMPGGADLALLEVSPQDGSAEVPPAVCRAVQMTSDPYLATGWPAGRGQQVSVPMVILRPASPTASQADLTNPTGYPVNPGMSGGGVASADGAVVGLVAMRETRQGVLSSQVVLLSTVPHPVLAALVRRSGEAVESQAVSLDRVGVRAERFVGREDIFAAIDDRLSDPAFTAGYLLLTGEPGAGKTAIMAELAATRGWLHHFNRATDHVTGPAPFLRNMCAQLILRHGLPHRDLPAGHADNGEVLKELVAEAVTVRRERGEGPLVMLVDALDEAAEPPERANRLFLPEKLPEGVYFVASVRERAEPRVRTNQWSSRDVVLRPDSAATKADLLRLAERFVGAHAAAMEARLTKSGTSVEHLVDRLVELADGNFMYLVQVLPGVVSGIVPVTLTLDELPRGLGEYYRLHWEVMRSRDQERFRRVQRPVVAMLATAHEPVSVEKIVDWINGSGRFGAVDAYDVLDVLEEWGQFLRVVGGDPARYSIYHATFLRFLATKINLREVSRLSREVDDAKIGW